MTSHPSPHAATSALTTRLCRRSRYGRAPAAMPPPTRLPRRPSQEGQAHRTRLAQTRRSRTRPTPWSNPPRRACLADHHRRRCSGRAGAGALLQHLGLRRHPHPGASRAKRAARLARPGAWCAGCCPGAVHWAGRAGRQARRPQAAGRPRRPDHDHRCAVRWGCHAHPAAPSALPQDRCRLVSSRIGDVGAGGPVRRVGLEPDAGRRAAHPQKARLIASASRPASITCRWVPWRRFLHLRMGLCGRAPRAGAHPGS
jgi:hypothetical protein